MPAFQRVLCPVDFSATSTKALLYAERLARETSAELILPHPFDAPLRYDPDGQYQPARPEVRSQFEKLPPFTRR